MKYVTTVAALLLLSVTSSAFAAPKSSTAAALVCPVTGGTISSIKDAAGHSTYKGKTYYFCCPGCKPMFDANPAKYLKSASSTKSKAKMG